MFENEVNYRLAKWMLLNMQKDGILTEKELRIVWKKLADSYSPPFLEVENMDGTIGDGVRLDAR